MDNKFIGYTALITGAGQGIGKGVAEALYRGGAAVHALDKNQDLLQQLKSELPDVHTHVIDLSDWDKTRKLLSSIENVRLLVNNVGVTNAAPFLEATKQQIDQVINTNIMTVINISQIVAKDMITREQSGSIVNVCSLATRVHLPFVSMYAMSKTAVERLTKSMAKELGQHKIRVNSVHPVLTRTPSALYLADNPEASKQFKDKVAIGRFAEIDDIVQPIMMLLDEEKSGMISGSNLYIDGAYD